MTQEAIAWLYEGPNGEYHVRQHRDVSCHWLNKNGWKETPLGAAAASNPASAGGWIVGSSDGQKWRVWTELGPDWTDDRDKATRYARRVDAEQVHAADEDAWLVELYATAAQEWESDVVSALRSALSAIGHNTLPIVRRLARIKIKHALTSLGASQEGKQ